MPSFETPEALRRRLRQAGLSYEAIDAAWPEWWSDAAIGSPSAEAELRFGLARNLGLAPSTLMDAREPQWIWRDRARFKRLTSSEPEQAVLSSFGRAVALAMSSTLEAEPGIAHLAAGALRGRILQSTPFVTLGSLIRAAWQMGIPVAYLRVFPLEAKRMDAMSVAIPERAVVLLARDTTSLARLAFILAHELGHIALGHVHSGQSIIDDGDVDTAVAGDEEESSANAYAFELLTGFPDFKITIDAEQFNSAELAQQSFITGIEYKIDPGVVALAAGFASSRWKQATAALKILERLEGVPPQVREDIPATINRLAAQQLHLREQDREGAHFLRSVLAIQS